MCYSFKFLATVFVVFTLLVSSAANALERSIDLSTITLKDLSKDERGFLANTGSDGFLVLDDLNVSRDQLCGLVLTLEFDAVPQRASKFDLYWRTDRTDFSELKKAFFLINQNDTKQINTYLIPLCKLYNFSGNVNESVQQGNITGLRLDYPSNKNLAIRFESIHFFGYKESHKLIESNADLIVLEPYETVSREAFTSIDTVIPKLIFAFEEGLERVTRDSPFLVFWVLLIVVLKLLILRSYIKQLKSRRS